MQFLIEMSWRSVLIIHASFCPSKLLRTFRNVNHYFVLQPGFNCSCGCLLYAEHSVIVSFTYLQNAILGMS